MLVIGSEALVQINFGNLCSVDQLCTNMKENFDYRALALIGIMFMA